jgi:hypothetical protein
MVKGKIMSGHAPTTILTGKTVAQENVKASKGGMSGGSDIFPKRNDTGNTHG